jgi:hypothetical protein
MLRRPGAFSAYIKKLMEPKKGRPTPLRPADVVRLTGGKVNATMMSSIMNGKAPWNTKIIDALAKALKTDSGTLRDLAATDWVTETIEYFKANPSKVFGRSIAEPLRIPLVESDALGGSLSAEGYPLDEGRCIVSPGEYGPKAYAILMKDETLKPKANAGDICVVAPSKRVKKEDFGIVGTKKSGILMGQLRMDKNYVIVEHLKPYNTFSIERRNVRFIFRVEAVVRGGAPERQGPPARG